MAKFLDKLPPGFNPGPLNLERPLDNQVALLKLQADLSGEPVISIFPGKAWLAVGGRPRAGKAAWDHQDVRIEIDPEFKRARMNDRSVSSRQPNTGTGLSGRAQKQCRCRKYRGELVECWKSRHGDPLV